MTDAAAQVRVVTVRVVMGPAPTGPAGMARAAMDRRARGGVGHAVVRALEARGADPGSTRPARSTAPDATARDATGPVPTARGRSSPVPPDRAGRTIAGVPPDRVPTVAGRAGRVGGARVPGPTVVVPGRTAVVRGPTVVVRGPDRAIDSDRVRGRGHGSITAPMTALTSPATNRGAPTIARPDPAAASTVRDKRHETPAGPATDRAPVVRRRGVPTLGGPTVTDPAPIGRIDRGRAPIDRIRTPRVTSAAAARPDRVPWHHRRRSDPRRSWWPAGARSKRPSSPDVRPSGSSSCPSVEPPSRSSCCTPRTCASRSSRSKADP